MSRVLGIVLLFVLGPFTSSTHAQCIKGNCLTGYGTYQYANGSRYVGEFLEGKPHGKGILYFANGNKYIGHWADNFRQGKGRMVYVEGHEYFGQFQKSKFHGYGVMSYANGDRYEGNWSNDRPKGLGTYFFSNGDRYEGEFSNGRFHGQGVMFYGDGSRFDGHWLNNKKDGRGIFYHADGRSEMEEWTEGTRTKEFNRKLTDAKAREEQESFLRNCNVEFCANGTGTYTYADQTVYKGEFRNGQPEGEGRVNYPGGDRYVGGWKDHAPHGKGTMYYANGVVYYAIWEYGRVYKRLSEPGQEVASGSGSLSLADEDVKIWALVIGVGSYQHMPLLKYTDDDAYQVYAFLKSPEGGALPDDQLRLLIDEDATHRNILFGMQDIFLKADANDVVLFYFSGHGLDGAFLPVDYDGYYNRLKHEEIKQVLVQSKAKHKLVVADACHSGSLLAVRKPIDASLEQYYKAFDATRGGLALLMSSKKEEFSLEDGGLRSGVFSHYLISGLKGQANSDGNKIITISELFEYVHTRVRSYTARAQTPILTGSFDPKMPVGLIR